MISIDEAIQTLLDKSREIGYPDARETSGVSYKQICLGPGLGFLDISCKDWGWSIPYTNMLVKNEDIKVLNDLLKALPVERPEPEMPIARTEPSDWHFGAADEESF